MKIDFKNAGSNHIVLFKKKGQYSWHYNTIDHWIMEYWASYIGVENDIENAYYGFMKTYEVSCEELTKSIVCYLSENYITYKKRLMPSFYINFDDKIFISNFFDLVIEDRLLEGWTGQFKNFTDLIPENYKYWISEGENLLLSKKFLKVSTYITALNPNRDIISFIIVNGKGSWYVFSSAYWAMNYWSQFGIPKNIPQQEQEKIFFEIIDFFKMETDFLAQVYQKIHQKNDSLDKKEFLPKIYANFDKKIFYTLQDDWNFEKSLHEGWDGKKFDFIKMIPVSYIFWS